MIKRRSYNEIRDELLNNLQNTTDKTPSSFSYDNLSADAIIFEDFENRLYLLSRKFDVDNLEGEELEKRVFQIAGISRKQPTQATGYLAITGDVGTIIPQNTVFLGNDIRYTIDKEYVIGDSGTVEVQIIAEEYGAYGNVSPGIINKTEFNIPGINDITNPLEIHNGYIQETDDDLRERYYDKIQNPPKAGNPAHYKMWAEEVDGVGNAKVFRTWDGPSTVKVVLIGLDRTGVDEIMIQRVNDHIMEEAPIHWENLTVVSADELAINISAKLTIKNGYNLETVKENVIRKIEEYLYNISFRQSFISYAKIGGNILASDGVVDYDDLTVNGVMDNITLEDDSVGVLGILEVTV